MHYREETLSKILSLGKNEEIFKLDYDGMLDIKVHEKLRSEGYFEYQNTEDARQKVYRSIVQRQGQREFRRKLLELYDQRCVVTDCNVVNVLEAAHIIPCRGESINHPANGLLLRADIHTLFDLGMISIDPDSYSVRVSPNLTGTYYASLEGKKIHTPLEDKTIPSQEALRENYHQFLQQDWQASK